MKLAKAARPRRIPIRGSMEAVAALIERAMELAFLDAVARAAGGHDLARIAEIARRLAAGTPLTDSYVLGAYQWAVLETELARALIHIEAGVEGGASIAREALARQLGLELEARLDLMNPYAVRAARQSAASLVTNITRETMLGIRAIVTRAQAQGITVEAQAEQIAHLLRMGFGLTERQAVALGNYQNALVEAGTTGDRLEQLVAGQRERYIGQRALNIARTESMKAANAGQDAIWREAQDQGFLPQTLERRWIVSRDERLCPICQALDGQRRPMGEEFESPHDGTRAVIPPAHPQCRCTLALVVPDV